MSLPARTGLYTSWLCIAQQQLTYITNLSIQLGVLIDDNFKLGVLMDWRMQLF